MVNSSFINRIVPLPLSPCNRLDNSILLQYQADQSFVSGNGKRKLDESFLLYKCVYVYDFVSVFVRLP